MANIIKIRRSSSTATPTSLNEGELAVSFLSGKLFVGNSSAVIPIGGVHSPGTLTANQALVANSTSGIDKVIVANLVASYVYANGAFGVSGQVLSANSTGGVYWDTPVSSLDMLTDVTITSVANNNLLIYDAGAGQWENHSLSGTASQVNVAYNSQDITISLPADVIVNSSLTVGNSTVNSVVNSTVVSTNTFNITGGIAVGSNVSINTSTIFIGNSTVNTTIQAGNIALRGTQLTVGNTTFDGNSLTIGNSTVNTQLTTTSANLAGTLSAGNTDITGYINVSSTANVGGSITARANVTVNGALLVANTADLGNTTVTGFVNATVTISVGSNVVLDTSSLTVGNSTVNAVVNSTAVNVDGEFIGHRFLSSNISLQAPTAANYAGERLRLYDFNDGRINYAIGVEASHIWTAVDGHSNSVGFKWYGNNVLAARLGGTGTLELKGDDGTLYTDNTVFANVAVSVGNSTVNAVVNSTSLSIGSNVSLTTGVLSIGNSTVNTTINSTSVSTGGLAVANLTVSGDLDVRGNTALGNNFGTDVVSINATVNTEISPSANNNYNLGRADLRWGEVNANNVLATNVAVDSIVTVGSNVALSTSILSIGNSTVNTVINSTSVSTNNITTHHATLTGDLDVQGNTKLGNATSDVVSFIGQVNTHIIPSANLTYSLGNNTLYWAEVHTGNVHADYGYFQHDVAIYGDLTVTGNLVTTNVQSVVISDPLIYLAGNNYTSDLVDIGFVGNYHTGGQDLHTGLFRDASVDQYYLFKGLTQELDSELTVNTADPTFALADLNAWLQSGALISNSLAVTITANSTVNVNITANSLSLTTALDVPSGGTGVATFTTNGVLFGNGTGALQVTAAGTDGQVLQANSTGGPVFADLDGGTF